MPKDPFMSIEPPTVILKTSESQRMRKLPKLVLSSWR